MTSDDQPAEVILGASGHYAVRPLCYGASGDWLRTTSDEEWAEHLEAAVRSLESSFRRGMEEMRRRAKMHV